MTGPRYSNYTPPWQVQVEGGSIGLVTCVRCGATVMINPDWADFNALAAHNDWHGLADSDTRPDWE